MFVTPPFTHNIDEIIKNTIADMDMQSPQEFYDFVSLNVTSNILFLLDLLEKLAACLCNNSKFFKNAN